LFSNWHIWVSGIFLQVSSPNISKRHTLVFLLPRLIDDDYDASTQLVWPYHHCVGTHEFSSADICFFWVKESDA